jgi:membrane protein implicated in regulation of membrane protease activity
MEEGKELFKTSKVAHIKNFFSIARFGPDTLFLLGALSVVTLFLFQLRFTYSAIVTFGAMGVIFAIESVEMIHLEPTREKRIVGAECLVIDKITRSERGIVRIYDLDDREFGSELWSAESDCVLEEGTIARVTGISSIILRVDRINNVKSLEESYRGITA